MITLSLIGIGTGNPDHLTAEAVARAERSRPDPVATEG